jgi:ubiquinone/menaquinone biosynthesis C-methylase UbiE
MTSPSPPTANVDRFLGLASGYDAVRPAPPALVVQVLCELAGVVRPARVVDLGSGTGLSTRVWADRAGEVIGVEPNHEMRRHAEGVTKGGNIRYLEGTSSRIDLSEGSVDIVTCVQSLHWMEPESTFAEVARCLRVGGIFAALDCDFPPLVDFELDQRFQELLATAERLIVERRIVPGLHRWDKKDHAARMRASGRFGHVRVVAFHLRDRGDGARLIGLARSQGGVATALRAEVPEVHALLAELEEATLRRLGTREVPWTFTYRARLGAR